MNNRNNINSIQDYKLDAAQKHHTYLLQEKQNKLEKMLERVNDLSSILTGLHKIIQEMLATNKHRAQSISVTDNYISVLKNVNSALKQLQLEIADNQFDILNVNDYFSACYSHIDALGKNSENIKLDALHQSSIFLISDFTTLKSRLIEYINTNVTTLLRANGLELQNLDVQSANKSLNSSTKSKKDQEKKEDRAQTVTIEAITETEIETVSETESERETPSQEMYHRPNAHLNFFSPNEVYEDEDEVVYEDVDEPEVKEASLLNQFLNYIHKKINRNQDEEIPLVSVSKPIKNPFNILPNELLIKIAIHFLPKNFWFNPMPTDFLLLARLSLINKRWHGIIKSLMENADSYVQNDDKPIFIYPTKSIPVSYNHIIDTLKADHVAQKEYRMIIDSGEYERAPKPVHMYRKIDELQRDITEIEEENKKISRDKYGPAAYITWGILCGLSSGPSYYLIAYQLFKYGCLSQSCGGATMLVELGAGSYLFKRGYKGLKSYLDKHDENNFRVAAKQNEIERIYKQYDGEEYSLLKKPVVHEMYNDLAKELQIPTLSQLKFWT